ncbi:hypothetical protein [uncultured Chryseobacterium sp.]|uniref:hypothetical protein n=1 Tax=uncultured Chryseobacterium sp. TaxID=259322 RepID=UPI00258E8CF7|nr:hypothetical protein [uncultured Chryseobacterium sp.]
MKSYPYIHSLSTIGLIHHYNNDYIFNRFRTDFTGDSGTGKSMIADLLQLIFVGSYYFEAATESIEEKRKPSGMVLNDKSRGLGGKGYAFLNIAVDKDEYLILGMYLESSTNTTRSFIVHQGYDMENPTSISKPFYHQEFLKEQKILPIEDLKGYLKNKNLNIEVLQTSNYHKFLFDNEIIPFDLADNPEKLKTFALIIRSFSRGKGFKFDNESLQNFLFGQDREKEIKTSYDKGVESIKSTINDSLDYQKQIKQLTEKKEAIFNLIQLEEDKLASLQKYLEAGYMSEMVKRKTNITLLEENRKQLSKVIVENLILKQFDLEKQQSDISAEIIAIREAKEVVSKEKELREENKIIEQKHFHLNYLKKEIDTIDRLLPAFDNSIERIKTYYSQQQQNTEYKKQIHKFLQKVKDLDIKEKLVKFIQESDKVKNINEQIDELKNELKQNEALLKFSNVNDEKSLANWAINRKKAFDKYEESVLIKLQYLVVTHPENTELKYLPFPDTFFDKIQKENDDENDDKNGFWLDVGGILEYIPFTDKQVLKEDNPEHKKNYFTKKYASAQKQIEFLNSEIQFLEKLNSISGLSENLELYSKHTQIEEFKIIEELNIREQKFQEILSQYKDKEEIIKNYYLSEKEWKESNKKVEEIEVKTKVIKNINDIDSYLSSKSKKIKEIEQELTVIINNKSRYAKAFNLEGTIADDIVLDLKNDISSSSLANVTGTKSSLKAHLRTERKEIKNKFRNSRHRLKKVLLDFEINNFQIPDNEIHYTEEEIESLELSCNKLNDKYRMDINTIINNYFEGSDKYKYEGEEDWRKIAKALLPGVFNTPIITKEQFSTEVEEKLNKIIEQNSVIGDRKVQMLIDVFNKVESTFSTFSNEIDNLRKFFNEQDKRITGGYKIILKFDPSKDFPIHWIREFKKQMRQESTNRTGGLFAIVDNEIDFKEIIQKCFKQCGGKKVDPKISDLLNPKSYFQLTFSLQNETNKNSGSTGQVYSAIALLCIARISLIDQTKNNKPNKGIRFMPVDEAEGLGSNYEMLSNIAKNEDYQIISMSINPVGEFEEGNHFIYMLNEPEDENLKINGVPFAQFTEEGIDENIHNYFLESNDE